MEGEAGESEPAFLVAWIGMAGKTPGIDIIAALVCHGEKNVVAMAVVAALVVGQTELIVQIAVHHLLLQIFVHDSLIFQRLGHRAGIAAIDDGRTVNEMKITMAGKQYCRRKILDGESQPDIGIEVDIMVEHRPAQHGGAEEDRVAAVEQVVELIGIRWNMRMRAMLRAGSHIEYPSVGMHKSACVVRIEIIRQQLQMARIAPIIVIIAESEIASASKQTGGSPVGTETDILSLVIENDGIGIASLIIAEQVTRSIGRAVVANDDLKGERTILRQDSIKRLADIMPAVETGHDDRDIWRIDIRHGMAADRNSIQYRLRVQRYKKNMIYANFYKKTSENAFFSSKNLQI